MASIESILTETRVFPPADAFVKQANVSGMAAYQVLCRQAETDYEGFWADQARRTIDWKKPFTRTLDESNAPFYQWFDDGELNVSYNCLDRHLATRGDKTALIFEAVDDTVTKVTYKQLHARVCQFANGLQSLGVTARATYDRRTERIGEPVPETFLTLSEEELKRIGFSRQKIHYVRLLSEKVLEGSFRFDEIEKLCDDQVRLRLMDLKGIGSWIADIYLLMALRRPDVWPKGDLALISAVARIKRLPRPASVEEFEEIGELWRPWRSVAARIAWFEYLGGVP